MEHLFKTPEELKLKQTEIIAINLFQLIIQLSNKEDNPEKTFQPKI